MTGQGQFEEARRIHALEVTDEMFRLLVDRVKDYAIFLISPEGNVMTWNGGAEALKGYRSEEIIGRHFGCFYPEGDLTAGKPARLLQIAVRDGRVEDEGWRVRKDGSQFWADVVITALRDERGELRGFAKVTRDLSERREAELRLERRVQERTAELEEKNVVLNETVKELEAFHDAVVGRELKMIELERRVAELEATLRRAGASIPRQEGDTREL